MSWSRVRHIPSTAAEPHPGWETPGLDCGFLGTEKRFPDGDQRGSDRAGGPAEGPSSGPSAEQWRLPPGPGYIILGRAVSPFAGAKQLGAL